MNVQCKFSNAEIANLRSRATSFIIHSFIHPSIKYVLIAQAQF